MKTGIGIVLGVVIGIVIITVAAVVLIFNLFGAANRTASTQTPLGTPVQNPATSPAVSPAAPPVPSVLSPSTAPVPSNSNATAASPAVDFNVNIGAVENTGLTSRKITGQITNTGTVDAHNVTAKVQVFCQGSLVKINNQDFITQPFGTIKAGDTVSQGISVSFSILDAGRLTQNGATVNLTITSDETTRTFSYNIQP
jgi:hypothetical protein